MHYEWIKIMGIAPTQKFCLPEKLLSREKKLSDLAAFYK